MVKFGALAFVLFLDRQNAINLQLLGGVWILQTLLAIVVGLYTRWFHRWALLVGLGRRDGLRHDHGLPAEVGGDQPLRRVARDVPGHATPSGTSGSPR